jgi:hypothetical protein
MKTGKREAIEDAARGKHDLKKIGRDGSRRVIFFKNVHKWMHEQQKKEFSISGCMNFFSRRGKTLLKNKNRFGEQTRKHVSARNSIGTD